MSSHFHPLDDDAALAAACAQWAEQPVIFLDTEFERSRTYFPKPALLQVYAAGQITLIDPLRVSDTGPFSALLKNTRVIKVMHACSEDLEVFKHWLNTVPEPLFDTQIAAAFAGLGFGLSLANIVQTVTGTVLDKAETRSDWLRRPLSATQLHYAAQDVAHLEAVYRSVVSRLARQRKLDWARAECNETTERARREYTAEQAVSRMKCRDRLDPVGREVLADLAYWRDLEAMRRDRPRKYIAADASLCFIAEKQLQDFTGGRQPAVPELRPDQLRRYAQQLRQTVLDALRRCQASPPAALPSSDPRDQRERVKRLAAVVRECAVSLDLPPELLAPRRALTRIAQAHPPPATGAELPLDGWRLQAVGDELLAALNSD